MRLHGRADEKVDLQPSVVGTYAHRSFKPKGVLPDGTFPNERVVRDDLHLSSTHLRAKRMRLSGNQRGNWRAVERLNVPVSPVPALRAGVLAGVALDGDHQLRFRLDAPHRIYQVASVLSTQLNPKLAPHFARRESCFIFR